MLSTASVEPEFRLKLRRRVRTDLPLLRRFGRMVTGSQAPADTAIQLLMEEVLRRPGEFETSSDMTIDLFRRLRRILAAIEPGPTLLGDSIGCTPLSRQALLLARVDGFHPEAIAYILDVSIERVAHLLSEAATAVRAQPAARLMIIEDEPVISLQLELLSLELGHQVVGLATTLRQAVGVAAKYAPDLILSDIQLADGSCGIDAIDAIDRARRTRAVFITAHPEKFLKGRRNEPLFLITKPFDAEAVKATISQALFLDSQVGKAPAYGATARRTGQC